MVALDSTPAGVKISREMFSDREAFLARFDPLQRSTVANTFLEAVRKGAATPNAVCRYVRERTLARLSPTDLASYTEPEERAERLRHVVDVLSSNPDLARRFAAYSLAYERLPYADRQRVKAAKGTTGAGELPPTEKQLAFLRALGDNAPPPQTRSQASERIQTAKEGCLS